MPASQRSSSSASSSTYSDHRRLRNRCIDELDALLQEVKSYGKLLKTPAGSNLAAELLPEARERLLGVKKSYSAPKLGSIYDKSAIEVHKRFMPAGGMEASQFALNGQLELAKNIAAKEKAEKILEQQAHPKPVGEHVNRRIKTKEDRDTLNLYNDFNKHLGNKPISGGQRRAWNTISPSWYCNCGFGLKEKSDYQSNLGSWVGDTASLGLPVRYRPVAGDQGTGS